MNKMNVFRFDRLPAVLLSLLVVVVGCDQGTRKPTAPQPDNLEIERVVSTITGDDHKHLLTYDDGRILLYHPTEHREDRELFVPLRSERQGMSTGQFALRLFNPASDSSQTIGAEIYSATGSLLFGLQIEIDSVDIAWARITEYTSEDRLSMLRVISDDSVTETYTENGTTYSVEYSRALFEHLTAHQQGLTMDSLESEYLAVYEMFASQHSTENSLSANPDGDLLVSLISDQGLFSWLDQFHQDMSGRPLAKDISLDDVCFVAEICAMIKCAPWGGGLLNPLCVPCGGIGFACLAVDAFNFITKWF